MTEFDPRIAELTTSGATAALLLDAQKRYCGLLIEVVLARITSDVINHKLTADAAIGYCHEIAAYRQIVHRQEHDVERGRRIENG